MARRILPDQTYLRECFDYEPETGRLTWRHRPLHHFVSDAYQRRWNTTWAGTPAASVSRGKYRQIRLSQTGRRKFYVHRIIWKWMTGNEPDLVDHRKGDGLDNRWETLRNADYTGNSQNNRGQKDKASGLPKGVSMNGVNYRAQIRHNGTKTHLGTFKTIEEARRVYCEAAVRLHGEFANLGK